MGERGKDGTDLMLCHHKKPGDLTYPLSPRFGVRGAVYDVSVLMKSCT